MFIDDYILNVCFFAMQMIKIKNERNTCQKLTNDYMSFVKERKIQWVCFENQFIS